MIDWVEADQNIQEDFHDQFKVIINMQIGHCDATQYSIK